MVRKKSSRPPRLQVIMYRLMVGLSGDNCWGSRLGCDGGEAALGAASHESATRSDVLCCSKLKNSIVRRLLETAAFIVMFHPDIVTFIGIGKCMHAPGSPPYMSWHFIKP